MLIQLFYILTEKEDLPLSLFSACKYNFINQLEVFCLVLRIVYETFAFHWIFATLFYFLTPNNHSCYGNEIITGQNLFHTHPKFRGK